MWENVYIGKENGATGSRGNGKVFFLREVQHLSGASSEGGQFQRTLLTEPLKVRKVLTTSSWEKRG